jgi:hypothetical protein
VNILEEFLQLLYKEQQGADDSTQEEPFYPPAVIKVFAQEDPKVDAG